MNPSADALRRGAELFDARQYFEAHETWEEEWRARTRGSAAADLLQGLAQCAAAAHKLQRGELRGARSLAKKGAALVGSVAGNAELDAAGAGMGQLDEFVRRLQQVFAAEAPTDADLPALLPSVSLDPARKAASVHLFATAPAADRKTSTAVVRANGAWHVVALHPFEAGERILHIEGARVPAPSMHSIQVDDGWHVEIPSEELGSLERVFDGYPWRFLNHSCAPSARVQGRELLAVRRLRSWEEITFDYNTTEDDMASPFVCRCGHCDGRTIGGFRKLSRVEQERLAPNLAPHLRRRLDRRNE